MLVLPESKEIDHAIKYVLLSHFIVIISLVVFHSIEAVFDSFEIFVISTVLGVVHQYILPVPPIL